MKKKGFTLLEVLLAMVILSSGIILLVNSWSGAFLRIRKTKITTEIAFLLERKVTEYEMKYRGKPISSLTDEEDDFGSEFPQYSWKAEVKDLEAPDITSLVAPNTGGNDDQMLQMVVKTLIEHLNKVIKEVKITVTYKGGKKLKPLSHSITTYFIDYDKEIQLPGIGAGALPGGGS